MGLCGFLGPPLTSNRATQSSVIKKTDSNVEMYLDFMENQGQIAHVKISHGDAQCISIFLRVIIVGTR